MSHYHLSNRFCDSVTLSDSFSNIQRCNLRILSEPPMVTGSVSHEVDNTILVGNQIGFNMNGKESDVQHILANGIQETMTGGILAVWDTSCFSLIDSLEGNGFLALLGNWCNIESSCLIIVVYASQDYREKKKLSQVITFHNTFTILLGDFNEVRSESERTGTIFDPRGAAKFNDFITIADLCELPMGGKRFTRMNNLGSKLSKIDRVLISNHVIQRWPNSHVFALPREFSDHTHICEETHARTLWNKLEQLYARKTGNNKLFLIKQMMRLKYTDGSPITDHLNAFQGIINQLAGMGIKFEDEIQGLWLLGTLPDTWETFRTSLSNSAPDGVITMELAKGSILNEETRRKSQGSSSQSDVLVTERRGRSQSRGPSNRGNHRSSSSKGKFADVECYHCHKKGHTMKFCRQLKKENKKKNYNNQKNKHKKDDDGDDNTEVNTTTDEFFVCYDYDMVNLANDDSSWILDSGATCHVATRKDYYSSYTPGDFGVVRMGNTGLSRIAGIGDICLKFDTGMELVLHNVKHVPDMRLNIISTGLLDEDGYHNSSGNGLWKVTLGSLIVARGKRESKLYMTHPKISKSIVNAVDNDDMTELWHKRLGHMSEKGMSILSKKNVLSGVHDINLKKCSHCLAGKQTRLAFKSRSPFRMENILDLVHSDVCGPMKTKTLGGCSYFVTFIDDHSRKVWVYTLKTKDQVLDMFKQFHALVERQTGKKLKCIRTDSGGEYIGPFDAYCKEHGIQHQKTPPNTSQLNGLAERMNRTLVERVRCLLSHAGLPTSFWGKAFNTATSVHIPKDKRSKLDVKDVEKAERETIPQHNDDLIDLDLVPPKYFDSQFGDDIQNDEEYYEEQDADDVDAQEQPNLDEDVHPELPVPDMPLFLPLRRSTRDHHPSTRYSAHEYVLLTNGGEPECYAEAMEDEHKKEWFEAIPRYKARLVVKGFSQKRGIDFDEIFSPVVKMGSIQVVLGLAASLDLEVEQMDVNTAFLHALRQWYKKFESVIGKQGYRNTSSDHCVFFQKFGDDDFIILLLYVDDMLIVGKNIGRIAQLKGAKKLHISQEQYIEKVICKFNMDKDKVVSSPLTTNFKLTDKDYPSSKKNIEKMDRVLYASAVGSLMYAMVCTRPNLAHAVGVISRFLSNPGNKHWEAVKWIFRYPQGTSKLGITFRNGKPMLVGFTDSYMDGNKDNMKSTSEYLITFVGGAVSWQSRLQKYASLSTTEAEYMAATEACKELFAIHLAKNSMFHKRTKHIDIRYHWIRDAIEDGMFELNKVHTDDNASDMLTKAVAREKLKVCGILAMVDDNVLNHICEETHARTLWNKLEQLYARKTGNNKLFLIKQMMRLKYTDGSPITDHLNAFQGIINQLAGMGIKFEDEIQGLCSWYITGYWETFRTSLSQLALDGGYSPWNWLRGGILNQETKKVTGSSSQSRCLGYKRQGKVKLEAPSNRGAHDEVYRQLKKENKKKNYNNQKNKHKKDDDGDDNTEVNTTTDEFFVCYDYDMVNLANDDSSWILDSGDMCQMCQDNCLKFNTGKEFGLHNVKQVPDTRLNIISTDNDDITELWHKRLGHMSEKGMSILSKKNIFVCKHLLHIPKDERSKLDVKTKPCVFLGYGQDEFGVTEARKYEYKKEWFEARKMRLHYLHENNTFDLVKLPKGKRALKKQMGYKLKIEELLLGPRMGSIRVSWFWPASLDLEVESNGFRRQLFLHGDLE
ncbi:putative RNA-directed DNA polymerase [Tanacetum coccineum]